MKNIYIYFIYMKKCKKVKKKFIYIYIGGGGARGETHKCKLTPCSLHKYRVSQAWL